MSNYLEQIESSLREKHYSNMGELITKYLKSEKYSPHARLQASEFYRRISEFSQGLELLHWQNESFHWQRLDDQEIRVRLQSIRLLNLLGASSFAIRMLDTIDHQTQQKYYEIIAPIYLSNNRDAEANRLYLFLESIPDRQLDYHHRLRLINLADSYFGLEKYDHAIKLVKRLFSISNEPAILAILNEALGSYYLRTGEISKAATYQNKAQTFFKPEEKTGDYGFLLKWVGARLIYEKKFLEAEDYLNRSFSILYQKGRKPEAWLEVLYWRGFLAWKKNPKRLPDDWQILLRYPAVEDQYRKRIGKWLKLPSKINSNSSPSPKITIHHHEEMVIEGRKNTLGLTLPQKILSLLLAGGEWGVPFYRACDAIWGEDLYSFGLHYKRLDQGLGRLRKSGLVVEWKDMHLQLIPNGKSAQYGLVVNLEETQPGGLFFNKQNGIRFKREDVENYFSLSRNRAAVLCKKWVDEGRVSIKKEGRLVYYIVLNGFKSQTIL